MRLLARLRSPALRGIWIGLACALVAWLAVRYTMLGGVEDWMLDGCFSFRGTRDTTAKIVIVAVDSDYLAQLDKPVTSISPELARVVTHVKEQGARAVGIDVMIPKDRGDKLAALRPGEEGDPLPMGQAVVRAKNVTLPLLFLADGRGEEGARVVRPLDAWAVGADDVRDLGFVNLQEDGDQFVRRQQLWGRVNVNGAWEAYPHLGLALYARWRGEPIDYDEEGRLKVGDEVIPADRHGQIRINYVGPPGSFRTIPFGKVLDAAKKNERTPELEGAIVLVGVTARQMQDYHGTPFANNYARWFASDDPARMPGVELNAHVVATLVDRAYVRSSPPWLSLATLLVVGAVLGHVLSRMSLEAGFLLALAHHFAWKGLALGAFAWLHWRVEMAAMLLLGFLVYAVTFGLRWRTLRRMFGVVKSEGVARALEADPGRLDSAGEEREVTVLFADVRDFTAYSEGHARREVVALLNAYFAAVVPAVEAEGGVIDKFMGDGIMALFGAPAGLPDHARRAARAAVAMVRAVHEKKNTWAGLGNPDMRIGVGVHTGKVVVGAIGGPGRLDYTAIGDVVNAAARIESENKAQGTEVLLSAATVARLTGEERSALGISPTGVEVAVKGKQEKLLLYAGLASPGEVQVCAH